MNNLRNSCVMNIGIGTLEIFKPANCFNSLIINKKSYIKKQDIYEYGDWNLVDEVFLRETPLNNISRKYEYIDSYTEYKNNIKIGTLKLYNVYERKTNIISHHSNQKTMKRKVA